MAKILVADDNSNIQKMVGLALKDQGIDVVAVGNGEAAVRKISDVRPDLVLADVFMPVRNGYEVCKYVKEDSALSHIPVILLVGAFDPLDEQEAQRVGADGVLKKPFVPPDPLISMVKSALSRAGVPHSGADPAHEAAPPPLRGTDLLTPQQKPAAPPEPAAFPEPEPFPEAIPPKPEPFNIDSSTQPLAFGSLLETPAEEETAYVTPASSSLAPERTWGAEEAEEEAAEEEAPTHAWRPLGGGDDLDDIPAGRKDWREAAFEAIESAQKSAPRQPAVETEIHADTVPFVEPEPLPATGPQNSASAAPAATESWLDSSATPSGIEQTESFVTELPSAYSAEEPELVTTHETAETAPQAQAAESAVAREPVTSSEPAPSTSQWFSVPSSPWDAEVKKATQLASTWDAPSPAVSEPAVLEEAESATETVAASSETLPSASFAASTPEPILEPELPAATEEAIREETAQIVEQAQQEAQPAAAAPSEAPATSANLDDVVAKVLAKMSPEVLQAVTKEILKPVVEAIVRDELGKK